MTRLAQNISDQLPRLGMSRGENFAQARDGDRSEFNEDLSSEAAQGRVFAHERFERPLHGGGSEADQFVGGLGAFGGVA